MTLLFKDTLRSQLTTLLKSAHRTRSAYGRQIQCHLAGRPHGTFGFSASIVTNNASLGDINGVYHFHSSRATPFRNALLSLTIEVADASLHLPQFIYFRVLSFNSDADVDAYIARYKDMTDKEAWLERAVTVDWKEKHHFVRERFENGNWTVDLAQEHETLHLLSDGIEVIKVV